MSKLINISNVRFNILYEILVPTKINNKIWGSLKRSSPCNKSFHVAWEDVIQVASEVLEEE